MLSAKELALDEEELTKRKQKAEDMSKLADVEIAAAAQKANVGIFCFALRVFCMHACALVTFLTSGARRNILCCASHRAVNWRRPSSNCSTSRNKRVRYVSLNNNKTIGDTRRQVRKQRDFAQCEKKICAPCAHIRTRTRTHART